MSAKRAKAGSGTPAARFLEARRIEFRLHGDDFDPGDLGIGAQAAAALGIDPARIFKTLMVVVDEVRLVTAVVPVNCETNLKALAAAAGGKRAAIAPLTRAERATGPNRRRWVKGGISPFGQRQRTPVVVDRMIECHPTVYVNGGRRGLQIELAPAAPIAVVDATVADIAR